MLFTTNSLLCNVSLVSQFIMAPKPNLDRSRSPKEAKGNEAEGVAGVASGSTAIAFDSMWESVSPKLDAFKEDVKGAVKNLVIDEMGKFEARIDAKLEQQASDVQGVKEAVDRIEQALSARIVPGPTEHSIPPPTLPSYAQVAGANPFPPPAPFPGQPPRSQKISPDELNESKFGRRPDPTVIFANTLASVKVELSKWKTSVERLAEECDLAPSLFKVTGEPLGNRLEVRFLGDPGTAANRATQLLDSLKLGGGKYKEQSVLSPDKEQIQFFLNPDKPPCQVRKEILGKALLDLLKANKPTADFTLQRVDAKIWANKRPLCFVKIVSESEAKISWMDSKRVQLGIDLGAIEPEFAKVVADKGEKWT